LPCSEEGEDIDETEAVYGYGLPTWGTYWANIKGYKTFGSTGQGEYTEGITDINDELVSEREIIVTVGATAD
jgi:hypothetical protein